MRCAAVSRNTGISYLASALRYWKKKYFCYLSQRKLSKIESICTVYNAGWHRGCHGNTGFASNNNKQHTPKEIFCAKIGDSKWTGAELLNKNPRHSLSIIFVSSPQSMGHTPIARFSALGQSTRLISIDHRHGLRSWGFLFVHSLTHRNKMKNKHRWRCKL